MRIASHLLGMVAAAMSALGASRCTGQSRVTATMHGPPPVARPNIVEPTVIGMNIGGQAYWTEQLAFADLIRDHGFANQRHMDNLGALQVDSGGHPINVPKGTDIEMFLLANGHLYPGTYRCSSPPGWTPSIEFLGKLDRHGQDFTVTIPPVAPDKIFQSKLHLVADRDGVSLDHLACRPADIPADQMFRPDFLKDMKPFRVIRFMNWMRTNGQPAQTWEGRPKPTDFSVIDKGAAVEEMVELANRLGADPWFTLPLDADAAYYRNFATYVRDHLAPEHRAYVELSNEVWNGTFSQARDAAARGKARYPTATEAEQVDFYYGDRVREVMKVWTDVYAGQTKRIVRVISNQHYWIDRSEPMLAHNDTWRSVDALASAPYFGTAIQDLPGQGKVRIDAEFARLPGEVKQAIKLAVMLKATANRFGLRYIGYEGGPDVQGYTPDAQKDTDAIVHDRRFYTIYSSYLEQWQKQVGDLLVLFDSGGGTVYQHYEYTGQPPSESAKLAAVIDFIARKDGPTP